MVIGGTIGDGFSITGTLEVTLMLPQLLRTMADQIEQDIKENGLGETE
jgi:hypothetical protein